MQREWTRTGDDCLDALATKGDPLECLICQDFEALNLVIQPYSTVWKDHIKPRRKVGGAFLVDEWQEFGGRHYTALIRLHHAMCARDEIVQLCMEEASYLSLLKVHSACATFWDNLGASIDNFMKARIEAKKILETASVKRISKEKFDSCGATKQDAKFQGRTVSDFEQPYLSYAFQRRNQFMHSIIVPHAIQDGEIVFDLRHYDDEKTKWEIEAYSKQGLGSKIEDDWSNILTEFGNAWGALYSYLQEHDKNRPVEQHSEDTWSGVSAPNYSTARENNPLSGIEPPKPSGA